MAVDTISNWTVTTLTKFVRDQMERFTPRFLPILDLDELRVVHKLIVSDQVEFSAYQVWRYISGTGQPPFENAWVNDVAPHAPASFIKSPDGFVTVRGRIKTGTVGSTAFTLPPGYRSDSTETFAVASNSVFGMVTVTSDGKVTPIAPSSNTWVSLAGIRFKAS